MDGLGLEAFVAVAMRSRPDAIILREQARLQDEPRTLTIADIDHRSSRLASLLSLSRLAGGSTGVVMTAAGSDQLVAVLGLLRAGLNPVLQPLSADMDTLQACFDASGPSVAIASTHVGDLEPALIVRNAAARSFNVRLVCAFGDSPPDGVAPLDGFLSNTSTLPVTPVASTSLPPAGLTIDTSHGVRQVVKEADLVAAAVRVARITRIAQDHRILNLMMSPSLCAIATGPYLAMLSGAELFAVSVFSSDAVMSALGDGKPTTLVAPASTELALRAAGLLSHDSIRSVLLIHRDAPPAALNEPSERVIDLFSDADNTVQVISRG